MLHLETYNLTVYVYKQYFVAVFMERTFHVLILKPFQFN